MDMQDVDIMYKDGEIRLVANNGEVGFVPVEFEEQLEILGLKEGEKVTIKTIEFTIQRIVLNILLLKSSIGTELAISVDEYIKQRGK